jgi:hypothetical protein
MNERDKYWLGRRESCKANINSTLRALLSTASLTAPFRSKDNRVFHTRH